jgi:hypothetical protein
LHEADEINDGTLESQCDKVMTHMTVAHIRHAGVTETSYIAFALHGAAVNVGSAVLDRACTPICLGHT